MNEIIREIVVLVGGTAFFIAANKKIFVPWC
jgi:hypothetical protein